MVGKLKKTLFYIIFLKLMSKTFKYSVNEIALSLIESGAKKIEGRLYKNTFINLKIGDKIIFFKKGKNIMVTVTNLTRYKNFKSMLLKEGISRVTPLSNSLETSLSIYNKFYSKEDELKYGVLAITIEKYNRLL